MVMSVYLEAMGRPQQAVAEMQEAVSLDPLSFFMNRHYGSALFYARRYPEALRQLKYAREMHLGSAAFVDLWISQVYAQQGRQADAVRNDLLTLREDGMPVDENTLSAIYQTHGWAAYWAERLKEALHRDRNNPCFGYDAGRAATLAGVPAVAIGLLKQAAEKHCYWMVMTRVDPVFDELGSSPAFAQVVDRLQLPPRAWDVYATEP